MKNIIADNLTAAAKWVVRGKKAIRNGDYLGAAHRFGAAVTLLRRAANAAHEIAEASSGRER